ncbi:MAG: hypothetical protein HFE40_01250 [Clostridia bacterium]|jgi:hypothetical protein|nr:hypothetical protein [Clostridia bacterium]
MLNREQDINGAVKRLFACIIFFVDEKKNKENGTYEAKCNKCSESYTCSVAWFLMLI